MMKFDFYTASIALLLCVYTSGDLGAQDYDQMLQVLADKESVVPPAAEAAELGKYGETSVNLYTGVPNISVPIYTVQGHDLSVPIGLQYNASGNKVADGVTWVGLGWSLSAGGSISRVVLGELDLELNYYSKAQEIEDGLIKPNPELSIDEYEFRYDVANGTIETQPDQFYATFGGRAIKFYISPRKRVYIREYADIIITPTFAADGDVTKFTIVDETGTTHVFDSQERTEFKFDERIGLDGHLNRSPVSPTYNSAWHLSTMTSRDQEEAVSFSYTTAAGSQVLPINYALYESTLIEDCDCSGASTPVPVSLLGGPDGPSAIVKRLFLNKIEYKLNGVTADRLDFNSSGASCTVKYALDRQLDDITLYRSGSSVLKTWDFDYNCSTGRLTLEGVQEESGAESKGSHLFEYDLTHTLPNFTSTALDHWGYLNGNTSGTLVPSYSNGAINDINRRPDEPRMKAGSIKKITYPTGGYTVFELKGNKRTLSTTNTYYQLKGMSHESCSSSLLDCCPIGNSLVSVSTSIVNITQDMIDDWNLHIRGWQVDCDDDGFPLVAPPSPNQRALLPAQVSVEVEFIRLDGTDSSSYFDNPAQGFLSTRLRLDGSGPFDLDTGLYELRLTGAETRVTVDWEEEVTAPAYSTDLIGGLRVESMKTYDFSGTQLLEKSYSYSTAGNANVSSGILFSPPRYATFGMRYEYPVNTIPPSTDPFCKCMTIRISGISATELGRVQGSPIGYSRVVETTGLNFGTPSQNAGQTVHVFHNEAFGSAEDPVFNGKLIKRDLFDVSGDMVQSKTYGYSFDDEVSHRRDSTFYGYSIAPGDYQDNRFYLYTNDGITFHWSQNIADISGSLDDLLAHTKLERKAGKRQEQYYVYPTHEETTDYFYDNGATNSVVTRYDYTYSSTDHLQRTEQQMTNSDNTVYIDRFYYPEDYIDDENSGIGNTLLSQNKYSPPWKTEQYTGSVSTPNHYDGTKTTWKTFGSKIYPEINYRWEHTWLANGSVAPGSQWKEQSTVKSYDARGLVSQLNIEGWTDDINYTWTTQGKLSQWKFKDFEKDWSYISGSDLVQTFTDIDKTSQSYTYDGLLRLKTSTDNQRSVTEDWTYHYSSGMSDYNYIRKATQYTKLGTVAVTLVDKTFMDGIGRKLSTKKVAQGPLATESVVISQTYDGAGRLVHKYEPRSVANITEAFEVASGGVTSFSFEDSPLNRLKGVTPPGWHETKYDYQTNTGTITVPGAGVSYGAGTLYEQIVTDPNDNITRMYGDKRGREIQNNRTDLAGTLDYPTYTLYDPKDRVSTVLPPSTTLANTDLIYQYLYYGDDLLDQKTTPDKGTEKFRYNERDLLYYYQDPVMMQDSRWYVTGRDDYGRSTSEGWKSGSAPTHNATANVTPTTELVKRIYGGMLDVELDKLTRSEAKLLVGTGQINKNYTYDPAGRLEQQTQNTTLDLASDTSCVMAYTFDGADNILTETIRVPNGMDRITTVRTNEIDFAGRRLKDLVTVGAFGQQEVASRTYTAKNQLETLNLGGSSPLQTVNYHYFSDQRLDRINDPASLGGDAFGLKLYYDSPLNGTARKNGDIVNTQWQALGDAGTQHYTYGYDYLDRLEDATSSSGNFDATYTYTARGNLNTLIRKGMDDVAANGQIDNLSYTYASGNRLSAITDAAPSGYQSYGVKGSGSFSYDANGNMERDASQQTDLSYNHLNLLDSIITDAGEKIVMICDALGVMQEKQTLGADSVYNSRVYLHPVEISNGFLDFVHHDNGYVKMGGQVPPHLILSGTEPNSGIRQGLKITSTRTVPDALVVVYEATDTIRLNANFRVEPGADFRTRHTAFTTRLDYVYSIKDHLGNNRVFFSDTTGDGTITADEILSKHNYYAFGMEWNEPTSINEEFGYRFNDKEKMEFTSYGMFGARCYDGAIGRFQSVDPIADVMPSWASYSAMFNNPVRFTDPTGMAPFDWVQRGDGSVYWDSEANSQSTTKSGETYLGTTLALTFNSYIDAGLWDGPGGTGPAGDKLTSTITLKASENNNGNLTGVMAGSIVDIGSTPIGNARAYFPGLGPDQNGFRQAQTNYSDGTLSSFLLSFEQHASVSPIEALGLNMLGFDIVNVAQRLDIATSGKELSISAGTDVFPSATLSVNGSRIFQYDQPSFRATHGRDRKSRFGDNGMGGSITSYTTSRRQSPQIRKRY